MKTNTVSALRLALAAFVCTMLTTTNLYAQMPTTDGPVTATPPSLKAGIWPTTDGQSVRVNFAHKGRQAVHVRLYDSRGKALYDQPEFGRTYAGKFNLSDLPAGVYTIDLQLASTHISQSISIYAPQLTPSRIALINTVDYFVTSK